jgi:uncharacterized membrane protein HdeD (DUF308 family)
MTTSPSRGRIALRGLLASVVGLGLMLWPSITIGVAAAIVAVYGFIDAFASGAIVFRSGETAGERWLAGLRGLLDIGVAVFAIAWPGMTAAVLATIVGIFAIAVGVSELTGSSVLQRAGVKGTGWAVAGGVLSILAGFTLIVWPGIGAVTLAILFGAYLFLYGAALQVSAARNKPVPVLA